MGAVFKAERTDGELEQVVAIKIAERLWFDPHSSERFRRERQILAGLSHPNIARLLDGGTREDGVPYLVMEYVEGERLDLYCDSRRLTVAERLRVFLPLCHAVEFAHCNLVVHRDLKPSNVLVTGGGEPKLLDFGIAKALDSSEVAGTQTLVLTPDFASPEQARGEALTTATDVYGLGAVLYHLLTGHAPHATAGLTPFEIAQAIGEPEVTSPAVYRPELRGDLENILMKAIHRDPSRRYGSAAALAEDIERLLQCRPVRATPDSACYRARRFAVRNRVAVAAASLALAAVLAGGVTATYEARRAQKRFAQVRKLAGRFLFDFEESIRLVPGTLEARRMVAGTAREYLESLEADARSDLGLKRELADSHYRLSEVERAANESDAALHDLERALALWRETADDCCGAPRDRSRYIDALYWWAGFNRDTRNLRAARAGAVEVLSRARQWLRESPAEYLAQRAMFRALWLETSVAEKEGKATEARAAMAELAARYASFQPREPVDDDSAMEEVRVQASIAYYLLDYVHDGRAAREVVDRSLAILNGLIQKHPDNAMTRNARVRITSIGMRAAASLAEQDPAFVPEAMERARSAWQFAGEEARHDPRDTDLADLQIVMTQRFAVQLRRAGDSIEAARLFRESVTGLERLMSADPHNRRYRYLRGDVGLELGKALLDARDWRGAAAALEEAARYTTQAFSETPDDARINDDKAGILAAQAQLAQRTGDLEHARERCQSAFQVALQMIHKDSAISVSCLPALRVLAAQLGVADPTTPANSPEGPSPKR
jgi:non-specific serine/threonine protein kinase/serine/threonine-protein kinase